MSGLPQPRFAQSPLLILAVAISIGILLGSEISVHSRSVLILGTFVVFGLGFLSIWLVRKRKLTVASMLLVAAFTLTCVALSSFEGRDAAPDRISSMYERGLIAAGDPVELTGTIDGQPEPAPQSFYLKLMVEKIRFEGSERDTSGTVLLLAHLREPQVK